MNVCIMCLFITQTDSQTGVDLFWSGVVYVLEDRLQSHCVTFCQTAARDEPCMRNAVCLNTLLFMYIQCIPKCPSEQFIVG